ncbi:MAG: 30S ribosomal protein S6 [Clostridia bacterium]|jgi:small subunit ribosomal protein S6|nr:30S ribosomal protein S6 [Clostridia bacterium]
MRNYEAMYILRPELGEEEQDAVMQKFADLVTQAGGEVVKLDKWGKRRLAYEVKKLREGIYILMQFRGTAAVAKELDRVLKITDEVIRQLVVRLDDDLPVAEEQEEQKEEVVAAE